MPMNGGPFVHRPESQPSNPPGALGRNAACHRCRKRKQKCDGVKPVCTPCRNPLRRKHVESVECTWDDVPTPPSATRRSVSVHVSSDETSQPGGVVGDNRQDPLESMGSEGTEEVNARKKKKSRDHEETALGDESVFAEIGLIWPEWPEDLPPPGIVEHIATVFFDKVPMIPRMLRRQKFLSSLALPVAHRDFPPRSLIHAVIAITAPYLTPDASTSVIFAPIHRSADPIDRDHLDYEPDEPCFKSKIGTNSEFQSFHRKKAMARLSEDWEKFANLISGLQALIMIAQIDLLNARNVTMWQEAGACVRCAVPLLLNESPKGCAGAYNRFMCLAIEPAKDALEQAERDRTWWMAWLIERQISAPGYWPMMLADKDITVELPVSQVIYELGFGQVTGTQTLHSPDLFAYHPPHHSDSFVLLVKAMKVHSDFSTFLTQYTRGPHSKELYVSHPEIRRLRDQIADLKRTFPSHLRRPLQAVKVDADLLAAIWLVLGLDVNLGEPVIADDWTCELSRAAQLGIKGALSLLHELLATSFDLTLLSEMSWIVWFHCGRVLCLLIESATLSGDLAAAAVFHREVAVFRKAIAICARKWRLANLQRRRLDTLLEAQQHATFMSHTFVYDYAEEEHGLGSGHHTRPKGSGSGEWVARGETASVHDPGASWVHATTLSNDMVGFTWFCGTNE